MFSGTQRYLLPFLFAKPQYNKPPYVESTMIGGKPCQKYSPECIIALISWVEEVGILTSIEAEELRNQVREAVRDYLRKN